MYYFKVFCSATFSTFAMLYSHQIPERLHHTHGAFLLPPPHPHCPHTHRSAFCVCGFADSGHFIEMESYNMMTFVPGFLHVA